MTITDAQNRPQQVLRGVVFVIAAGCTISVQDVVFKLFSSEMTLWQIFSLRAILMLPLFWVLARLQQPGVNVLKDALHRWTLLRALFFTLNFMGFYAALPFLSLSTIGAANYIAPIFITLLSAYAIGEPVGRRGWIAVFVGFAGVVILLQPGTDAFSPWALLVLAGAFSYALAHITTRTRCQGVPLVTLALSVTLVMLAAGITTSALVFAWGPPDVLVSAYPSLLGKWSAVSISAWLILCMLAALSFAASILLAGAYQAAPPSIVGTFEYSYLVFVVIWDIAIFAIPPSATTITGMVLIIGAGLMVLRRL